MSNVVSIRRAPSIAEPAKVAALVVAGSGGAAATTTTYGLATALRLGTGKNVTAVDSTTDGGNLLNRVGVGAVSADRSIDGLRSRMAVTSSGMVVVGSGDSGQMTDPAMVDMLLAGRDTARFYDVGTALRSSRLSPLIQSGAALVVVAPARSEPLSRMRSAMQWLASAYGQAVLDDTIVLVSHQMPSSPVDLTPIRDALAPRIAGFVEVPFDPELARPGIIDHRRLSASTIDAWTDALDVLGSLAAGSTDENSRSAGELA
ncbi:hypothetical protein FEZ60_24965 [Rhodococcus sp. MS16]|uniref:hypothetical protein n=1 Tax=Rhodococcus sp. MS16 TaxID=2579941 RepID=UPI0015627BB3|nr:hypothetical protein [Rhodococcus sp. MS16]NRI68775.1 hypothetical protein [Rhodococcus sp. MS16]